MRILGTQLCKSDEVITRNIAGETLIVPVRGRVGDLDSIYTLNDVASTVWQLIDGQRTIGEIVRIICDEYDVSQDAATKDVMELTASLEEAGLISTNGSAL